jgi:hypothetical protein
VPILEANGKTNKSAAVAWRALPKIAPNAAAVWAPKVGVNAAVISADLFTAFSSFINNGFAAVVDNNCILSGSPYAENIPFNGPYSCAFKVLIFVSPPNNAGDNGL